MKNLIQTIIRLKNPEFRFSSETGYREIFALSFSMLAELIRAWVLLILHGKAPGMVFMGKGVRLRFTRKLRLGAWVRLEESVYISALGKGGLEIGQGSRIGAFSRLVTGTSFSDPGSHIYLGQNVGIGEFAYLGGAGGLEIGEDCIIGQYFSCHPENHIFNFQDKPTRLQGVSRKGIKVGRNCWIGSKVTILDGVEIGAGCVIAAGAVVTRTMPAGAVVGGIPAKVIKMINYHDRTPDNSRREIERMEVAS